MAVYPPHPEEGASRCAFPRRKHRVAPVSKDGAATWFETPRTRLRNLGRSKVAAPHHEAGKDRECIESTGIRFSAPIPKFASHCGTSVCELRNQGCTSNLLIPSAAFEFEVPTRVCGDGIGTSNSPH